MVTTQVTKEQVLEALKTVQEPELGRDLVSLNMIKDISVLGGSVKFTVELTTPACPLKKMIEDDCKKAVSAIPGVEQIAVNMTSNVRHGHGGKEQVPFAPGVKNFIAVAAGKGGVGKSTVAVNLAVGLAKAGAKVGLLDADIYGPSVPLLTGVDIETYMTECPPMGDEKGALKLRPIERFGIKLISIGFLIDPKNATIWRGPMVHQALQQLLADVSWGELDYLIVDMPPGTGDAQLTLCQSVPLTGAVIVCTPQPVALADAQKAVQAFQKTRTEILGVVENMSYFECNHCHEKESIFGSGGAEKAAKEWNTAFLGALPINTKVRQGGDEGKPVMAWEDDPPVKQAFRGVVERIAAEVSKRNASRMARRVLPITRT